MSSSATHVFVVTSQQPFFPSVQILTSVVLTLITVTPMLSVLTLRVLITARAALDTMEMEHYALVNHIIIIIIIIVIIIIIIIISFFSLQTVLYICSVENHQTTKQSFFNYYYDYDYYYYYLLLSFIIISILRANVCKNRATGGQGQKLNFVHILSIHTYQ